MPVTNFLNNGVIGILCQDTKQKQVSKKATLGLSETNLRVITKGQKNKKNLLKKQEFRQDSKRTTSLGIKVNPLRNIQHLRDLDTQKTGLQHSKKYLLKKSVNVNDVELAIKKYLFCTTKIEIVPIIQETIWSCCAPTVIHWNIGGDF